MRADPYRVWLSEIMLQQTTVPHATPYFLDFTRRWPTVDGSGRGADDGEVMAAWAGLGYYARARNLLACARAVARDHGGVFPDTEAGLRALPGVGAYTAAAIAAIAFDRPANVVDGNVERVMARLFAVETPLPGAKPRAEGAGRRPGQPTSAPGDWAQALMDLGATVCRPKRAALRALPARRRLRRAAPAARRRRYPRRDAKAERPRRHGAAYRADPRRRGRPGAAAGQGPAGRHAGPADHATGAPTPYRRTRSRPRRRRAARWRAVGEIEHVFTHFALTLQVWRAEAATAMPMALDLDGRGRPHGEPAERVPARRCDGPGLRRWVTDQAGSARAHLGAQHVDRGQALVGLEVPVGPAVAGRLRLRPWRPACGSSR